MWKEAVINAVVAVTSAIWLVAVVWSVGAVVWHGLPAL